MFDRLTIVPKTIITISWSHLVARNSTDSCCAPLTSTLSTDGRPLSSRVRCGLDMTMTPSVLQSSSCCLRLGSTFPHPSFLCSSIMSRSCELLLFTMTGPILRRNIASLNIGCTLEVSLVRRITFFSWRIDDTKEVWSCNLSPCWVTNISTTGPAKEVSFRWQTTLKQWL